MTEEVGNIVIGYLDQFRVGGSGSNQFIDKLAGVVQVISKTESDGNRMVVKSFPVSCNLSYEECNSTSLYKDLVPDSRLGCITYLEDVSMVYVGNRGRKMGWKGQYRLVCWVNKKKLGKASLCSISSQIITTFLSAFPQFPTNEGNYQQVLVKVLGQDPKSYNPFAKYSYDEKVKQYLMHPFEYFSLPIEVSFEIDQSCIEAFEKDAENVC